MVVGRTYRGVADPVNVASAFLGATIVATAAQPFASRQGSPDFRSETNFVRLAVRVVDRKGEFVRGLTSSDFRVLEDGKPQTIAAFNVVDIPFIPNSNPVAETREEVFDSTFNPSAQVDGRVYLFILDDLLLETNHTLRVRTLVNKFIRDKMSANDIGSVVLTSDKQRQPFTANRDRLMAAVENVVGTFDEQFDGPLMRPVMAQRVRAILASESRKLGSIEGRRKALVFVSPTPLCFLATDARGKLRDDGSAVDCATMFDAAVRSDVTIYAIDPRGPTAPKCTTAEWSGEDCFGATVLGAALGWRSRQSGERTLAEETGGFAARMTNSFDTFFDQIVRENSAYYLIGYYSTNDRADGKFRKHEIRVRQRDVRVVHRAGYLAKRPKEK